MGAMPAVQSRAPRRSETTAETRRRERLQNVGDVVRLYEQLAQVLGETTDADLERLAAASRAGGRAFGDWAHRIESFRIFKRSFEDGTFTRSRLFANDEPTSRAKGRKAIPFLWETIAFVLGFGVSLLWA